MDAVKEEKEWAMLRCRRLRLAATLSRWLLEALAALAFLFWSSDRLPSTLALCASLIRRIAAVLFHPVSAFLVGNLIVVTLFAKSGCHSQEDPCSPLPPSPSASGDVHDRYYFSVAPPPQLHCGEEEAEEVVVYEDKAVSVETATTAAAASATNYCSIITTAATGPKKRSQKRFPLPRMRSSALPVAAAKVGAGEKLLRRSETDIGARLRVAERWWPEEVEEAGQEGRGRKAAAEEDNEEFRRRIETFISKQLRFIEREEESLLLAGNGAGAVVVAAGVPDHSPVRLPRKEE